MCFSLNTLNISLHSLSCMISNEERDEIFIFILLRNGVFFLWLLFRPDSLSLIFFNLNIICLDVILLGGFLYFFFIYSAQCSLSSLDLVWCQTFIWKILSYYYLKYLFCSFVSSPGFPITYMLYLFLKFVVNLMFSFSSIYMF